MRFRASGKTDIGLMRTNNEDGLFLDEKLGLFIVCDGVGGHNSGEIASKMAIDVIVDHIKRADAGSAPMMGVKKAGVSDSANRMASGIRVANSIIFESSKSNVAWRGMGSTVVAARFDEDENVLSIANVGDSRAYLLRDGKLAQATEDHSLIAEQLKKGLITKEEAEKSNVKNIITRALGGEALVEADMQDINIQDGDRVLLCTDGLTGMVADEMILSTLKNTADPEKACGMLIDMANDGGGKDNITVIVVHFSEGGFLKKLFGG